MLARARAPPTSRHIHNALAIRTECRRRITHGIIRQQLRGARFAIGQADFPAARVAHRWTRGEDDMLAIRTDSARGCCATGRCRPVASRRQRAEPGIGQASDRRACRMNRQSSRPRATRPAADPKLCFARKLPQLPAISIRQINLEIAIVIGLKRDPATIGRRHSDRCCCPRRRRSGASPTSSRSPRRRCRSAALHRRRRALGKIDQLALDRCQFRDQRRSLADANRLNFPLRRCRSPSRQARLGGVRSHRQPRSRRSASISGSTVSFPPLRSASRQLSCGSPQSPMPSRPLSSSAVGEAARPSSRESAPSKDSARINTPEQCAAQRAAGRNERRATYSAADFPGSRGIPGSTGAAGDVSLVVDHWRRRGIGDGGGAGAASGKCWAATLIRFQLRRRPPLRARIGAFQRLSQSLGQSPALP